MMKTDHKTNSSDKLVNKTKYVGNKIDKVC